MFFHREHTFQGFRDRLLLTGIFLGVIYWFVEASVHYYCFDEGPFWEHAFRPDVHETWMRALVAILLVLFGFYGQSLINQRRRAEMAVIEREKESSLILENNPVAIVLIDTESREIAYVNTNAQKMVGLPVKGIIGNSCHKFLCPSEKGKCPVLDLGQSIDISERPLLNCSGDTIPVLKSVTRVQYQGREHLLEAFLDITEQRRMQQAVKQAHIEMNQIFQTASVGMRVIDRECNILKVNRAFSELTGIDAGDIVGQKCYNVFAGDMCHTSDCPLRKILGGDTLAEYAVSKKRADGSPLECILTATRYEESNGHVAGIVESFKDVTELKSVQQVLESERDRLHRILFHQFESVGIINVDFELEYQNDLLKRQTDGLQTCYCYRVFRNMDAPCADCLMRKALVTGTIQRFEFDTRDGKSFEHTYTPFLGQDGGKKAVVSQRDITQRKASIAAALRSEHLAAIGELAAGVAHEINNPITGIINYGQLIVNKTNEGDPLNNISHRIIKEGDRIAAIVKSLLSFARQDNEGKKLVHMKEVIDDSLTLTRAQLRKDGIELVLELDDNLVPFPAKAQELQQVFVNIIGNSRYALNEKYKQTHESKRLLIKAATVADSGRSAIQASFTDWGAGISPESMDQVMRPFYSTKPKGKGTGLGLSISHQIIENHGGKLRIQSDLGKYTTVIVELPVQCTNKMVHAYDPKDSDC
ncbi:putative Histidine kinase [Desulfosarcina cetonica]|uniref:PAS domain S-box protein n=1 Tax=Desulfosarcina cetonica TaxID=90730 RepID=UPI0006D264AE|nr:PAS domain S-box protein [Desulfosarcina cetonica]VTR67658.1 putative Histidine kinase [Desulfosarcina cetonica]